MASLKAIRNGVEAALESISGMRIYDGGTINPPSAVVSLAAPGIDYHETSQNGLSKVELRVRIFVSSAYSRAARDTLHDYLDVTGSTSVKAAIESDPTLGGVISDLIVTGATELQPDIGGVVYVAADVLVTAIAP